jgi:hypothetical protein
MQYVLLYYYVLRLSDSVYMYRLGKEIEIMIEYSLDVFFHYQTDEMNCAYSVIEKHVMY